MLLKLSALDITKYWPIILESLYKTITKDKIDTEEKANHILKALLTNRLSCWFYLTNAKIKAIIITSLMKDEFIGETNLLIYSVYTKSSSAEEWAHSFDTFSKYGISRGCKKIIFYTSDKRLLAITRHFGFSSNHVCEIVL